MPVSRRRAAAAARRRADGERGFALVIFALMLFSLMVITALVVDLGAVYAHRRNDQNAADAAALAGAQELPDMAAAVTVIKQYANETLDGAFVNSDWNRCASDPGALPLVAPNNNCISFNPARTRVRVRLPDQQYDTFFASVAGLDTIRHSAFAIAGIRNQGFGSVLPFGLPGGAGFWDGYVCLKSAPNGQTQPPCGSHSGNFGYLDFAYFGNEDLGTDGYRASDRCGSGFTQNRIENNLAVGVDHTLSMAPGPPGTPQTAADTDACFAGGTEVPDNAWTQTGGVDLVDVGLFEGDAFTDGEPARLRRPNTIYPAQVDLRGDMVENVPLWTYIPTALDSSTAIPLSCRNNQFDDLGSPFDDLDVPSDIRTHLNSPGMTPNERGQRLLRRCVAHYQGQDWSDSFQESVIEPPEPREGCAGVSAGSPCTAPLFTANTTTESPDLFDIQFSPRFAYVPSVWTPCDPTDSPTNPDAYYACLSNWASGTDRVSFRSFQAVFIQRATFGSGNAGNITYWDAGFDDAEVVKNNDSLREITAFAFHPSMLPNDLGAPDAPFRFGSNLVVRLVR
jgi:hypothetical protein